jgi:hypothetical protein
MYRVRRGKILRTRGKRQSRKNEPILVSESLVPAFSFPQQNNKSSPDEHVFVVFHVALSQIKSSLSFSSPIAIYDVFPQQLVN